MAFTFKKKDILKIGSQPTPTVVDTIDRAEVKAAMAEAKAVPPTNSIAVATPEAHAAYMGDKVPATTPKVEAVPQGTVVTPLVAQTTTPNVPAPTKEKAAAHDVVDIKPRTDAGGVQSRGAGNVVAAPSVPILDTVAGFVYLPEVKQALEAVATGFTALATAQENANTVHSQAVVVNTSELAKFGERLQILDATMANLVDRVAVLEAKKKPKKEEEKKE